MGIAIMVALISGLASPLAGSTLVSEVFRTLIREIFGISYHQCGMKPARSDTLFE